MKRRIAIAAALAAITFGAFAGAAVARDCGAGCTDPAQYRGGSPDDDTRLRPRGPARDQFGGPVNERMRSLPPSGPVGREPLPDGQIWAIAKSRVPGRIVNARLQGPVYSFR